MDQAMKLVAALALCLPLAGCLTLFGQTQPTGSLCSVGPFIGDPGASQRLTRAEKEYVVTLNNSGQKVCGWTPPR